MVAGMPATPEPQQPATPPAPRNLSVVLPEDVAELLHTASFRTRRSKQDLVIDALRRVYGDQT